MRHMKLLCDIGELSWIFTDSRNLDMFLEKIVFMVANHMKTDVCSVYLYDELTQKLTLRATKGLNPESIGKVQLGLGEGLTGLTLEQMRPICEKVGSKHPNYKHFDGLDEEKYEAFLAVPILRGISRIGVLVVQRGQKKAFAKKEVMALQAVASQLANIIENTRLLMSLHQDDTASTPTPVPVPAGPADFYKGQVASEGFAIGHASVLDRDHSLIKLLQEQYIERYTLEDFRRALDATQSQLETLQKQVEERLSDVASLIFTAHLLMLKDPSLIGSMIERIEQGTNPPTAILDVAHHYAETFLRSHNTYVREKAQDIEDLAIRLVENLVRNGKEIPTCRECIVISRDLYPSDMLKLASEHVRGIVLASGGVTSHLSILARSLQIPMVILDQPDILRITPKTRVLLDAEMGHVYLNPSKEVLERFARREESRTRWEEQKKWLRPQTLTRDGTPITLLANINLLTDLKIAHEARCEGVGLYRTEFPFLIRSDFPSEEEQYYIYRKLIEGMKGKPVTLRTLDIGGDKILSYYQNAHEPNPFLGMRSIRFSLQNPGVFKQQLRAMLRAGAETDTPLRIMFPMISSLDEYLEAQQLVRECEAELKTERIAHQANPKIGVMIEVPSVLPIIDELAEVADFFSIGTNDLIQYLLAVDRTNEKVAGYYLPHHPSVLRSLHRIVGSAQAHQKEVSICGDMAHEERHLPFLLGIGVRILSLDAVYLPKVQRCIADIDLANAREQANHLLTLSSIRETAIFLESINPAQ